MYVNLDNSFCILGTIFHLRNRRRVEWLVEEEIDLDSSNYSVLSYWPNKSESISTIIMEKNVDEALFKMSLYLFL